MNRPLVFVALLYASGLLLADLIQARAAAHFVAPPLGLLFIITLSLAAAAVVSGRARGYLLPPLVILAGYTNFVWRTAIVSPHDLRLVAGDSVRLVTLRGELAETPTQRLFVQDEKESWRTLVRLKVSQICADTNCQPAFGRVLVVTPDILPAECFAGQLVEITGVLTRPPGPLAEGLFDYRAYLENESIYYQLKAGSTNDWRVLSSNRTRPLADRFLTWAQQTMARGLPVEDDSLRLLWAMTLGWRPALTNEVYEPFMRSGTMHIFAISGLHIALIAAILVALLRAMRISRAACGWVVIPLIWFYTAATGWQPSAIRSTVMMTIVIGGWALRRPSNLVNSLAGAALIILLWDPQQLFGASFQLSFFVVLSIALLVPPIERIRDQLMQPDPLLPPELAPRWRRWGRTGMRWLTTSLATSLAAWLGSLPLTAYYFHLFSPVTLLANLAIVPLSSLALAANLGSLLCGSWLPWLTELFNHSAWWWMTCIIKLSDWATWLPKAYVYVTGPSVSDFFIYYAILLGILSGWIFVWRRRWVVVIGICVIAGFYFSRWKDERQYSSLTIIPLNAGTCLFFDPPGQNGNLLIDCGKTNAVEFIVTPFLRAHGINQLPSFVMSHGDMKQIGGAQQVADLFAVKQVFASPARVRSPVYRQTLEHFETSGTLRRISRGELLGRWVVLHPEATDRFPRADDNAIVLRADLGGTRVLLLSDLGRAGQEALLARERDLRADIVVTGLPGQSEALSEALLEAIDPRLIVVTDSQYPARERAGLQLRRRLAERGTPVIYTRLGGAATLRLNKQGWKVSTMIGTRIEAGDGRGRLRLKP